METRSHLRLKRLALAYLLERGCQAVAMEVRCPISRYRVDAAGHQDSEFVAPEAGRGGLTLFDAPAGSELTAEAGDRPRRVRCEPRTIVIECKQCRADFLRDGRDIERLRAVRERLERRARFLEEHRIRHEEPHLRRSGSSLFSECEVWDFAESRIGAYRATLARLDRIDEQLYGETKFSTVARYRLADRLYVLAPRGMVKARETPPGWGLLECARRCLEVSEEGFEAQLLAGAGLRVAKESPDHSSRVERRQRLLRNIAVAATRASMGMRRREAAEFLAPPEEG